MIVERYHSRYPLKGSASHQIVPKIPPVMNVNDVRSFLSKYPVNKRGKIGAERICWLAEEPTSDNPMHAYTIVHFASNRRDVLRKLGAGEYR